MRNGSTLRKLHGYLKKSQSITFSSDGRLIYAGGSYGTTNVWEVATGRHLITLFAFPQGKNAASADDWLAYTPDGFYHGSPGIERYVAWRIGHELETAESRDQQFRRPDRVTAALSQLRPLLVPAPGSPVAVTGGALTAGDVNGDAFADLLLIAENRLNVYFGGDGSGRFKPAAGSPFKTGKGAWRLVVADFNGDGKPDVATRCVEANQLEVLLAN